MILLFQPMYEDIFNMFCKNKMTPLVDAKLKRDIYERAIGTDYKYIDNPEYYDNYTWAVNEYASNAQAALDLVNQSTSAVITVISMLVIIAALSPIAIVVTVLGEIVANVMYMVTNYQLLRCKTGVGNRAL